MATSRLWQLKSIEFTDANDASYRTVMPVKNYQMRYESITHRIRAMVKLHHKASDRRIAIDSATRHLFENGMHNFQNQVSISIGEQFELVIFEWPMSKVTELSCLPWSSRRRLCKRHLIFATGGKWRATRRRGHKGNNR